MGYVNNGKFRRKTLSLDKVNPDGSSVSGYPKSYSIVASFTYDGTTYAALTDTEFSQLSVSDYNTRLAAFYAYVDDLNSDCDSEDAVLEGGEAYGTNNVACPLGDTWGGSPV